MKVPQSTLQSLECSECGQLFEADAVQTFCAKCQAPLFARYSLDAARASFTRESLSARPRGLWRWGELLPVRAAAFRLTLGEADTPLLPAVRLGAALGMGQLFIKDESRNPSADSAARGMAVAVSRGLELGLHSYHTQDAVGALASFAARARVSAQVVLPENLPNPIRVQARLAGVVDALAATVFDFSAFREPYRLEGHKTLGFELAEALDWELPDVILVPTGSGLELVGLWKAFDELEQLGWLGARRPRMVSIQAEGCAPLVRAFNGNYERAAAWPGAQTLASGLNVPILFADRLILRLLRQGNGIAVAVPDAEILACRKELAAAEGLLASLEGAAALAALKTLLANGWLGRDEKVVLINPGSGLKDL